MEKNHFSSFSSPFGLPKFLLQVKREKNNNLKMLIFNLYHLLIFLAFIIQAK